VSLPLPLDVLHHEDHDGKGVEHQHKEDVEVGMTIVLVFLKFKYYFTDFSSGNETENETVEHELKEYM
jgi:hypothetical protein